MKRWILLICMATLAARAQDFHPVREKIIELKKTKMVEEVGLKDDEARQFLDIYGDHIAHMHDLTTERRKLSRKLGHMAALGEDVPGDRIRETIHELNRIDEDMLKEKTRIMLKMESILKPHQMAKYVLFEMRFDDKLRETLMLIRHRRPKGPPPFDFLDQVDSE